MSDYGNPRALLASWLERPRVHALALLVLDLFETPLRSPGMSRWHLGETAHDVGAHVQRLFAVAQGLERPPVFLRVLGAMLRGELACIGCGCTEAEACEGGCAWGESDALGRPICTRCAGGAP